MQTTAEIMQTYDLLKSIMTKTLHEYIRVTYGTYEHRVASNRPTEALASVISFTFVVYSHYKHS